jgi:hypothetical protein
MSSSSRYRLTMRKGPMPGKVFELSKAVLTIGREVKNDIVINDTEVSRQHVRLSEQAAGYQVEDLASTNGAFVNGVRLHAAVLLRPGDILGLGGTVELVYQPAGDPDATVFAGQSKPADPAAPPPEEPVRPAPAYAAPASPSPAATPSGGFSPSGGPPPTGGVQPWMWAVGIGCGVLALCACGLAVVLAVLGPQLGQLFQ